MMRVTTCTGVCIAFLYCLTQLFVAHAARPFAPILPKLEKRKEVHVVFQKDLAWSISQKV